MFDLMIKEIFVLLSNTQNVVPNLNNNTVWKLLNHLHKYHKPIAFEITVSYKVSDK